MDVCMRLAAGSLDVNRVYLEYCERDRGALFLWPAEGREVEAPSPSAARGCYNNVIKTFPWAQVKPWRSQISPFISGFLCFLLSQPSQPGSQRGQPATHHRQRETSDVREPPEDIYSRHGDIAGGETDRP
ncbi:hypothetical protein Taro_035434 [Colocasia esculenta]|uniref:Uncharacterized protein n=1 Tax=Colocasia esculenta TaxID=4460 RepID=A0A843WEV7_COLES|nr:hypothetical protein [Colocasia esculenta]